MIDGNRSVQRSEHYVVIYLTVNACHPVLSREAFVGPKASNYLPNVIVKTHAC
jgi:hypothetical protein